LAPDQNDLSKREEKAMLTAEENELLTRVGPGTPAGDLLRRYWHPIAIATDISDENPVKFVRILGEDLVLFQRKGSWASCTTAAHIEVLRFPTAESKNEALHAPIMAGSTTKGNCLETRGTAWE
jgi:hypothetical protein